MLVTPSSTLRTRPWHQGCAVSSSAQAKTVCSRLHLDRFHLPQHPQFRAKVLSSSSLAFCTCGGLLSHFIRYLHTVLPAPARVTISLPEKEKACYRLHIDRHHADEQIQCQNRPNYTISVLQNHIDGQSPGILPSAEVVALPLPPVYTGRLGAIYDISTLTGHCTVEPWYNPLQQVSLISATGPSAIRSTDCLKGPIIVRPISWWAPEVIVGCWREGERERERLCVIAFDVCRHKLVTITNWSWQAYDLSVAGR